MSAQESTSENTNADDSLQVAAREYPWLYMTTSLEKCFEDSDAIQNDPQPPVDKNQDEEATESIEQYDPTALFKAAQNIEFYDQLDSDKFASEGPKIMKAFLSHETASNEAEKEALSLAASADTGSLSAESFDVALKKLASLSQQAQSLEDSVSSLLHDSDPLSDDPLAQFFAKAQAESEPPVSGKEEDRLFGRTMILNVFTSTLPVLKARRENLAMATELAEGAKEVWAMESHLQSMEVEEDLAERVEEL